MSATAPSKSAASASAGDGATAGVSQQLPVRTTFKPAKTTGRNQYSDSSPVKLPETLSADSLPKSIFVVRLATLPQKLTMACIPFAGTAISISPAGTTRLHNKYRKRIAKTNFGDIQSAHNEHFAWSSHAVSGISRGSRPGRNFEGAHF